MITIYRRDGSVLFHSETATTQAQAINEIVEEARKTGTGANLADAYLADANLARANLTGAYLADANLARANLAGANLTGAYLADANLARANLTRAYLADANLARAYLADANLARANLARANLTRANLADANLARANLADAYLAGAYLTRAKNPPQLLQLGPVDGWLVTLQNTDQGWLIFAGCRRFTEAQARKHWGAQKRADWTNYAPGHGARMLAAVDALLGLAKAYGWPEKLVVEPVAVEAVAS